MTTNKERANESMALERRRRWSAEAKRDIVQETYQHGMSVSIIARK
jgi:transposase-like protein